MDEVDESEGDDNPPPMNRTRRVFTRPTKKVLSQCVEMLWYGELVRVRIEGIAVLLSFLLKPCPKTICKLRV